MVFTAFVFGWETLRFKRERGIISFGDHFGWP